MYLSNNHDTIERHRAVIIQVVYWSLILGGLYLGYRYLLPVLFPFIIAFLLAAMMNRPVSYLQKKAHLPRVLPSIIFTFLFAGIIIGLCILCGAGIVAGIKSIAEKLPAVFEYAVIPTLDSLFVWLEDAAASIDPAIGTVLGNMADTAFSALGDGVVQFCGGLLKTTGGLITLFPSVLMKTVITIIATVFITLDYQTVTAFLKRLVPSKQKLVLKEVGSFFGKTIPKCLISYVLIFAITCVELCLGFWLLRVPNGAFLAILIAILDILPVLGTGTVLIPWAIITMIQGNAWLGVGLLVLYVVITMIRNALEPRLVGQQINLHPILTFASMLIGLRFLGFLGLFGAPLLMAFLRHLHSQGLISMKLINPSEEEVNEA